VVSASSPSLAWPGSLSLMWMWVRSWDMVAAGKALWVTPEDSRPRSSGPRQQASLAGEWMGSEWTLCP
jgi:hypothetical protein